MVIFVLNCVMSNHDNINEKGVMVCIGIWMCNEQPQTIAPKCIVISNLLLIVHYVIQNRPLC